MQGCEASHHKLELELFFIIYEIYKLHKNWFISSTEFATVLQERIEVDKL